jgi:hypothetical protein
MASELETSVVASTDSELLTDPEQPVLLTDPHAHFREKERARKSTSPPRMQEKCGQRRVREVQADAVREALRLLDGKFMPQ